MSSSPLLQALEHLKMPDIEWAGFREVRETSTVRLVRDGKPEANHSSVTHGVMAEVLVNGQFAYASTPRLDPESLVAAARLARAQALRAAPHAVHRFSAAQRPAHKTRYTSQSSPKPALSPAELSSLLVRISEKLKRSPKIVRTTASAEIIRTETHLVSTSGADARQEIQLTSLDFEATAQDGEIVQQRTNNSMRGKGRQGGWEGILDTPSLWLEVDTVAEQALELVAAEQCPTETMSLVLMPDQMMLQIHESIGHPLELDRILGDERNYAGWSFVKPEDFGKLQYGSSLMNVTFDPTIPEEFASYAFDDNGAPARREFLIEGGLLNRALGGLESQVRSQLPGVANARATSWNRAPIDRMANINLEPGVSSWDDIIGSVERGVVMYSNRSWSIDDFRNKFQFGCEYAKLIENGKLTRTVRNPNYRGVTVPFWKSLKKVGDRSTFSVCATPNCGKGEPNQVIRVGHASPVCLFDSIEVFGGA